MQQKYFLRQGSANFIKILKCNNLYNGVLKFFVKPSEESVIPPNVWKRQTNSKHQKQNQ